MEGHPLLLPSSDQYDSVLCGTLGDITCNGQQELILGTYGKVICF